jgi:hypothetical protein
MYNGFKISRENYEILDLKSFKQPNETEKTLARTETVSEQSSRWLRKALGSSVVLVGDEPLEAIGSVSMSPAASEKYDAELVPLISDSIARYRERMRARSEREQTATSN